MKKNILKKFVFLLSLFIILFGYNSVLAEETAIPLECVSPQILNEIGDACIDPVIPDEIVPTTSTPDSVNIHLKIISGSSSLYNADISVNPCDSDNNSATPDTITAYCSILQSGVSSDWAWYDFGAMLNSINNIAGYTSKDKEDKDVYHYWSWSLNNVEAMVGLNIYELKNGDVISLNFIPVEAEIINDAPPVEHHNSSGSMSTSIVSIPLVDKTFSISNALNFLLQNKENSPIYNDWVAIAAGAGDNSDLKSYISNYLKSNQINSNIITDYERRAMALMALDINPYNGTNVNYIKKIVDSFDGAQFGDPNLINDDIFALIPLAKSGYTANDGIITKDINFILSKENSDGSWEESVDLTSATIGALKPFDSITGVSNALTKASLFIKYKQEDNGGWGNVSSSSWATQAMNTLGQVWIKNGKTTTDYFNAQQETTGAMLLASESIENRIWTTAYAIPAVLKLSWNDILVSFPKQENIENKVLISKEKNPTQIKITNKEKIYPKFTFKEETSDNLQDTNINKSSQTSTNTFFTSTHKILSKIASPFVWLWVRLGF